MSAFTPIADIDGYGWHVRFVPIADTTYLPMKQKERPRGGLSEIDQAFWL
jgi:hypothetical protein